MDRSFNVDATLRSRKDDLLTYLRSRATECVSEVCREYASSQFKTRASAVNVAINLERQRLATVLRQVAERENWQNEHLLATNLLLLHCSNVVMIEARHQVWPYDYMSFSRRIGELWEPFCTTCFEHPVRSDITLFVPPLFQEVRVRLSGEVRSFIDGLNLTSAEKQSLLRYYDRVWQLVTSGEIKLALDLHFSLGGTRFVVDVKSGFGSNEKGNTNRLLLVASVYRNIEPEDYRCLMWVRSAEEENNHYLQTLKNSGLWEVYCGPKAYESIGELSGFDLATWVHENVDWKGDLQPELHDYLVQNDLVRYLSW